MMKSALRRLGSPVSRQFSGRLEKTSVMFSDRLASEMKRVECRLGFLSYAHGLWRIIECDDWKFEEKRRNFNGSQHLKEISGTSRGLDIWTAELNRFWKSSEVARRKPMISLMLVTMVLIYGSISCLSVCNILMYNQHEEWTTQKRNLLLCCNINY
jgi:hypothetical protein